MKPLPRTERTILLRTDFHSDSAWAALCEAIRQPSEEGFTASLECVSDPAFDGLSIERLVASSPNGGGRSFVFLADRTTLTDPERPILVVDLNDDPGRTFRVIPREVWSVENNLSIANMDYRDFADSVGPDGVFRGFPTP